MVGTAYIVKSTPLTGVGSFQHFAYIYFSKSVCIANCGDWGRGGSHTYCQVLF